MLSAEQASFRSEANHFKNLGKFLSLADDQIKLACEEGKRKVELYFNRVTSYNINDYNLIREDFLNHISNKGYKYKEFRFFEETGENHRTQLRITW